MCLAIGQPEKRHRIAKAVTSQAVLPQHRVLECDLKRGVVDTGLWPLGRFHMLDASECVEFSWISVEHVGPAFEPLPTGQFLLGSELHNLGEGAELTDILGFHAKLL
jgi:hypothetical protein